MIIVFHHQPLVWPPDFGPRAQAATLAGFNAWVGRRSGEQRDAAAALFAGPTSAHGGVSIRDVGVPIRDVGGANKGRRVPIRDGGVPIRDGGVPIRDGGVPIRTIGCQ